MHLCPLINDMEFLHYFKWIMNILFVRYAVFEIKSRTDISQNDVENWEVHVDSFYQIHYL